jgi:hypothetical protein
MLAVEAPVRKLAVVAGAALAVAAFVHRPHAAEMIVQSHHRLTLHTETLPNAIYLTVFADGRVQHDDSALHSIDVIGEGHAMHFATRTMYYGCEWEGRESLVPIDAHSYAYSYDEQLIYCEPDARLTVKTPRTGIVTVDD